MEELENPENWEMAEEVPDLLTTKIDGVGIRKVAILQTKKNFDVVIIEKNPVGGGWSMEGK